MKSFFFYFFGFSLGNSHIRKNFSIKTTTTENIRILEHIVTEITKLNYIRGCHIREEGRVGKTLFIFHTNESAQGSL